MTTRRFLRLLAGAGCAVGAWGATGCVRRPRDLNIGVSCDFAPWCYIDDVNGVFTGFDVELARAACARLGWHPVFRVMAWHEKERLLMTGKIDCVWSAFTITGRTDRYTVLGPYADNNLVVLVRSDSPIRRNEDLAGKIVLAQAGSVGEAVLQPQGQAAALGARVGRLRSTPDLQECGQYVRDGLVDASVLDEDTARLFVQKSDGRLRLVADEPLAREAFGVGFRPRDAALRDRLAGAIRALAAEGVCAALAQRFFGQADRFRFERRVP